MIAADGRSVWLRNIVNVIGRNGQASELVCVSIDITQRKHAEEALRESEERLRLAIQAGKMYAYEWDVASDTVVRSAECVDLLGEGEPNPDDSQGTDGAGPPRRPGTGRDELARTLRPRTLTVR